jgi:hypothetical protein
VDQPFNPMFMTARSKNDFHPQMAQLRVKLLALVTEDDLAEVYTKLLEMIRHPRPEISTYATKTFMEYFVGRPAAQKCISTLSQHTEVKIEMGVEEMKEKLRNLGLTE